MLVSRTRINIIQHFNCFGQRRTRYDLAKTKQGNENKKSRSNGGCGSLMVYGCMYAAGAVDLFGYFRNSFMEQC